MSKAKVLCLVLAIAMVLSLVTLVACQNNIDPFKRPTEDLNAYLDTPDGDLTTADTSAIDNLFIAHKILLETPGFYGYSHGYTTAVGIKQEVSNTRYVVGDFDNKNVFKQMITKGIVANAYQLFLHGNNYIYRASDKVKAIDNIIWKDTAEPISEENFYNDFGHRFDKLTGYVLNYDTVVSGELVEVADGLYTYHYVLDTDSAPIYLRREMITNGNLQSEPTFSKAEIYVTMDAEWNIKSLRTDCAYKAHTMGINASCSEDITEVFELYDGELPEYDFFESYFGQSGGEIEKETTALDVLLKIFEPYLNGKDLQVALTAETPDEQLASGLISISGLDISDLSNLTVSAKFGELNVDYVNGDGAIYLKYQDFQGSTTVDGITELIDSLTALVSKDGANSSLLGDFDVEQLLEGLTYTISDDGKQCAVSLPVEIEGLAINANLYADIDGDNYTFTNANIAIGDVSISIVPQAWTVASRVGSYPEILGLIDLIENGTLALKAEFSLPLNGRNLEARADAQFNLATMNGALNVNVENYELEAVLVDNIVYMTLGEVKAKCDLTNIDSLVDFVGNLVGDSLTADSLDMSIADLLAILGGFTATEADGGVTLGLTVDGVQIALDLYNSNNRWQIGSVNAHSDQFTATVLPSEYNLDVEAPADGDSYADVTQLVETIVLPIIDLINGKGFGVTFNLMVATDSATYSVYLNIRTDIRGNLCVEVKVYDKSACILSAEVYYAYNTVYLTLDGIKVAFRTSISASSGDLSETINQLLESEQLQSILAGNEPLADIVNEITALVSQISDISLDQLLDLDLSAIITRFEFDGQVLSITLDGTVLGLEGKSLDLALSNSNGNLVVEVDSIKLGNVTLDVKATLFTHIPIIQIPSIDKYVLNLHGEVMGAEVNVTADIVNMDIWATVHFNNDTIYLRYVGEKVYVKYGAIAISLNTTKLGSIVESVGALLGESVDGSALDNIDIEALFASINFDLTSATPNITFAQDGFELALNFDRDANDIKFNNLTVNFNLDGADYTATLAKCEQQADQLDVEGRFVDATEFLTQFVNSVVELITADGYSISIDNSAIRLGDTLYSLKATVDLEITETGINIHANFQLSIDNTLMIDGELWLIDNVLYISAGDLKLAVALNSDETDQGADESLFSLDQLSELKGYNTYLDQVIDLVLDMTSMSLDEISIEQLVTSLTVDNGVLTVLVDGEQLGLSEFLVVLSPKNDGLRVAIANLAFDDVAIDFVASVAPRSGEITVPNDDFTTNLVIEIDDNNTVYANVDLINSVIRLQLVSQTASGNTTLDILYSFETNVIKLTNGDKLNVSVDVNSIADIVDQINKIVNEFAGADPETPLPGLDGMDELNLQDILASLQLSKENGKLQLALSAMGLDITVIFNGGTIEKVIIPVIEATEDSDGFTLTVKLASSKAKYATFSDNDDDYVRIDEVFNDFYYGYDEDDGFGTIQNLIYTNSWKFDFNSNSSIDVTNDDGTTTKYEIVAGSYFAFYYNKTDLDNIKLRAELTVLKDGAEFIILDVAYIDGRLYVVYDSNSHDSNGGNDLRATVAVSAIEECIDLLPALINVIPQIGDLIESLKESLSSAEGSLTLGNLASIFQSVSYSDKTFGMTLNGGVIDNLGEITLSATDNVGTLTLNSLQLVYSGISVNLQNITVSASEQNENGEFEYVNKYITSYFSDNGKSVASGQSSESGYDITNDHGYDMSNHMNFDSIRELLVALTITAGNFDDDGQRSFLVAGNIVATLDLGAVIAKADIDIGVTLYADIDVEGNSYFALKLTRTRTQVKALLGIIKIDVYADYGGNSYLLFDSKTGLFTIVRDSIVDGKVTREEEVDQEYGYCTKCDIEVSKGLLGYSCPNGSIFNRHPVETRTRKVIQNNTYNVQDYESVLNGAPGYIRTGITGEQLMANLTTGEMYLFEMLNLADSIENIIVGQLDNESNNVYGVEDILKDYQYSYTEGAGGKFYVQANLKPINDSLGTLNVNILHSGNLDDVYYDDNGYFRSNSASLTNISADLNILGTKINLGIQLEHTTPGFGTAYGYVTDSNYIW